MKKTVIGLTPAHNTDTQDLSMRPTYLKALTAAGALPLILPLSLSPEDCRQLARSLDGFVFTGGPDPHPFLFGEETHSCCGNVSAQRDSMELSLMKAVMETGKPILGICRGIQILNIGLGGTIYQDLSLRPEKSLNHMQLSLDRSDVCHRLSISNSSLLRKICGETMDVNSFHHQCINTLGDTLKTAAIAPDGVIEAVESSVFPFAVGVQWHPECMYHVSEPMKNLFLLFVRASKKERHIF